MSSTTDTEIETPEVAQVAASEPESAASEDAAPKSRREHIEAAIAARTSEKQADKSETVAAEQAQQRKYPGSWRKEAETAYRKAEKLASQDAELKALLDEIDKRETDYFTGVSKYKQQAEHGNAFLQAVEPFMPTIKQLGVAPHVAVQSLLQADHKLRHGSSDEKRAYLSQLAQMYGIAEQQAAQGGDSSQDALFSELRNEISQLKQHLAQSEQRKAQESAGLVADEINTFAQGKEHFDAVREDMAALLQSGRANTLQDAYERALWSNPEIRSSLLKVEEEKREQERKEAAIKARSRGVQVRGASPAGASLNHNPKDLRATIAAAMENLQ